MRQESDFLGKKQVPKDALYGINALRAKENFPHSEPFNDHWYRAVGYVKLACYLSLKDFKNAAKKHYTLSDLNFYLPEDDIINNLIISAKEVSEGKYREHFIVPAMQGGAGTAANMNINEIICNAALLRINKQPGDYKTINPFEDANIFQSTNDVMPTALKLASMFLLNDLEETVNRLRSETEQKERQYRHLPRIAYTQMQAAVPSSYGLLFGGYNEMLSRDWWRISKCSERIKTVNLGGGAAGTSLGIPTYIVMQAVRKLQEITKLPINGSENLQDTTANTDSFTEIHATLKAHAVNLEKLAGDLRILASDLISNAQVNIPPRQTGSSQMPGKVNPVISEFVISCAQKVQSNDMLIGSLTAKGRLDLNAYLPLIGHALLNSLELLIAAGKSLTDNMIKGLTINEKEARDELYRNPSVCTALNPHIGYQKTSQLAETMKTKSCDIFDALAEHAFLSEEQARHILRPENMLKAGFSLKDILPK